MTPYEITIELARQRQAEVAAGYRPYRHRTPRHLPAAWSRWVALTAYRQHHVRAA